MKKTIQLLLLLGLVAISTGCASTGAYFVDRGRDAADVFTASFGVGGGAKARVSCINIGLFVTEEQFGLRGGQFSVFDSTLRYKPYEITTPIPVPFIHDVVTHCEDFESAHVYGQKPDPLWEGRHKSFSAGSKIPFLAIPYGQGPNILQHLTEIEIAAGVGGTIRLGFNPGELLDFILGWTTIDIFSDDIERKKSNKILEDTGTSAPDPQD